MQKVLLETGPVFNVGPPITKDVLARVTPTLLSAADTLSLQQATNVLSSLALLSFYDVHLIAALVAKVIPELPTAPVETISALCYALGLSGYSDHRLMLVRTQPELCTHQPTYPL